MEKVIKLEDKEIRLDNKSEWTMIYRDQFGKDIIPTLMPLIMTFVESVSTLFAEIGKTDNISMIDVAEALQGRSMDLLLPLYQIEHTDLVNITWSMAKVSDENIAPPRQWYSQFEVFPVDVVLPTVFEMVLKSSVSSKNLKWLKNLGANLKTLRPSLSTTSFSPDSSEG